MPLSPALAYDVGVSPTPAATSYVPIMPVTDGVPGNFALTTVAALLAVPITVLTATQLVVAQGTITTDQNAVNVTSTWNASGVTFTAIEVDITATASAAASLIMDLKVGGASMFSVTKAGLTTAPRFVASADVTTAIAKVVAADGTSHSANAPVTAALTYGLLSIQARADATGTRGVGQVIAKQTAANTGGMRALTGYGWASHTSGTVALMAGVQGTGELSGNGGTTTSLDCVLAGGGVIGTGATVTNLRGVHITAFTNSGTVTNHIGLEIDNVALGGVLNYAIRTGTGLVLFGDDVQLGAVAGADVTTIGGAGYGAGVASLRLNGLTTGAGVQVGTLTNAPTAGNPTFWIPVNIAGTVLYVPAWP